MDIAGGSGLAIVQSALYPHRAHVAEEMLMATLLFVQLEITRQHNRVMAREVSATEGVSLDDQRWGFWPLLLPSVQLPTTYVDLVCLFTALPKWAGAPPPAH